MQQHHQKVAAQIDEGEAASDDEARRRNARVTSRLPKNGWSASSKAASLSKAQQQQQQRSQHHGVPKLSAAKSPAQPKQRKGKRRLPPKNSNQWTSVVTSSAWGGEDSSETDVSQGDDGDARQVNAGVYVLENLTTGHCYFGTTWDLKNAAAQSFLDLTSGAHPHQALAVCVQLNGADASGIRFRVLERVAAPASRQSGRRPLGDAGGFDAKEMERLLQRRLRFHAHKRLRQRALRLVRRLVLLPRLRRYWPRWTQLSAQEQTAERHAAAVELQCAWRARLAQKRALALRRARAAHLLQRFARVCAAKCVRSRLERAQLEAASARRLQRAARSFLARRRLARRRQMVRKWLQARRIQSCYRGYRGRLAAAASATLQAQSGACVSIQRVTRWRGALARGAVARRRHATSECQQRERAAATLQRVYWRYVAHKLWCAASEYALQTRQAAAIRGAYRNYVTRKFGWAALTLALETAMAARIQRCVARWFFLRRLRARVALERRARAAAAIQRAARGAIGRRHAAAVQQLQRLVAAARCVQLTWRASCFLRQLRLALAHWRREQSARRIQATYRRHRVQRRFLVARTRARREKAAVRLQCLYRSRNARREWRRRVDVKRLGPCSACGDRVAVVFSFSLGSELCVECFGAESTAPLEALEVRVYRQLQRLLPRVQRAYRAYQRRLALAFGVCGFCERKAVRVHCDACIGAGGSPQRFCRACAAVFHAKIKKQPPAHAPIAIEAFERRERAAVVIQAQYRRFAQRHVLRGLHRAVQHAAAARIQRAFVSCRQRRATRAAFAAHQQRQRGERHAAVRIQAWYRGHVARQQRLRLRRERDSAVRIQNVVRGRRGRLVACEQRRRREAATAIQRRFRGLCARREADGRRQEALRAKQRRAAVCIQKHARGRFARQLLLERKRNAGAVTLQLCWRRWLARRELKARLRARDERRAQLDDAIHRADEALRAEAERVAATRIQALARQRLAKRELLARRVARARQSRETSQAAAVALERASTCRIQRFVRAKWLVTASQRRLGVHCCARQFLSRRLLQQLRREKRAALTIQRAFRRLRTRRELAALAAGAAVLSPWVELFDEASGFAYYYNTVTAESSWDVPAEGGDPEDGEPEWLEYWDENVGASYFYNPKTGEATWATPEGVDAEADFASEVDDSNQSLRGEPSVGPEAPGGGFRTLPPKAKASIVRSRTLESDNQSSDASHRTAPTRFQRAPSHTLGSGVGGDNQVWGEVEDVEVEDVWVEADTEYDINYKIYLTQLERDTQQQQQQVQQNEQQNEQTEPDAQQLEQRLEEPQ
ncbi:hypothetical protein PybrP1_005682 [[Pythium] brassicae (nom. inval.)]|nr:hypothetical protein PybrP1_005682 [[Pythium] brassicae (nom. inval.)]